MESGSLDILLTMTEQMTNKILAIIPARGGSKGLPKKNILDLLSKPLIVWSIDAALNSKYITKTLVSSDNDEILSISKKYGSSTIKRPDILATDTASSESAVLDALKKLKEDSEEYDYLILLQPTSPLRDAKDIDEAFEIFFNSDATALISVCETDNKILKAFKKNDSGYIDGISNNDYPFARRQDLPKTYMSNGAIYIIKVDEFLKSEKLFTDKTISYVMSDEKSIDVDTKEDFESIETILKVKNA